MGCDGLLLPLSFTKRKKFNRTKGLTVPIENLIAKISGKTNPAQPGHIPHKNLQYYI